MRYYKEKEVETKIIKEYTITKIECDHCEKLINKGGKYYKVTEWPDYPDLDVNTLHIHGDCLADYITKNYIPESKDCYSRVELEYKGQFRPYETDYIEQYEDMEDTDENN